MKSHQLVSNRQIPAKLHDSLRFANCDDRNRSCSSVNAASPFTKPLHKTPSQDYKHSNKERVVRVG